LGCENITKAALTMSVMKDIYYVDLRINIT